MAIANFTGPTQLDDSVPAEVMVARLVATAYSKPTSDQFNALLGGHRLVSGGLTHSMTKIGKLSAAAMTTGDDGTATALADSQRSITIAEQGLGILWGDVLDVALGTDMDLQTAIMMMFSAYAERIESLTMALATSITAQVGDVNNPLTVDKVLAAVTNQEDADVDGPWYGIAHANGLNHLRLELAGTAQNSNPVYSRDGVLSRIGPAMDTNYVMTLFEIDFFKSSQCPTSGAGKVGMILPMSPTFHPLRRHIGVPTRGPFAGTPWDMRYEGQRDASGRLMEAWVTGLTQVGLADLSVGVGIAAVNS